MSNQVEQPGTVGGGAAPDQGGYSGAVDERAQRMQAQAAYDPGEWFPPHAFHGRPVSWVAVGAIMVGFLVGGLALVLGPTWWVFWVGLAIAVVGGLLALATNIFEDWY
jgi:hypothetical protein